MTPPHKAHRGSTLVRETWKRRIRAAVARRVRTREDRSLGWRLMVPAVFLLAGALFITSALTSDGTDLRAGRYGDLGTVVSQQKQETDQLRGEANDLAAEVSALSEQIGGSQVEEVRAAADALRQPAGLLPVKGPGLTISLDDAPEEVVDSADIEVDKLVVHQQDIQAVVNALWAGGAEAMTIQGQRVISTTGIKCVGNTVVLHDVPYSPPYIITAVGNRDEMLTSVNLNPYIEIYLQYVERYQLGWAVDVHTEVALPAYNGSLDLAYARPAGNTPGQPADSDI